MPESPGFSRRGFVKAVGGIAGAAALPSEAWAASPEAPSALLPQVAGTVQPSLALNNVPTTRA